MTALSSWDDLHPGDLVELLLDDKRVVAPLMFLGMTPCDCGLKCSAHYAVFIGPDGLIKLSIMRVVGQQYAGPMAWGLRVISRFIDTCHVDASMADASDDTSRAGDVA